MTSENRDPVSRRKRLQVLDCLLVHELLVRHLRVQRVRWDTLMESALSTPV